MRHLSEHVVTGLLTQHALYLHQEVTSIPGPWVFRGVVSFLSLLLGSFVNWDVWSGFLHVVKGQLHRTSSLPTPSPISALPALSDLDTLLECSFVKLLGCDCMDN